MLTKTEREAVLRAAEAIEDGSYSVSCAALDSALFKNMVASEDRIDEIVLAYQDMFGMSEFVRRTGYPKDSEHKELRVLMLLTFAEVG